MKKPAAFAVAIIAAIVGARSYYSRGNASLALAPIEKQSLRDVPNDGQGKIDFQKFGLDSAGAAPVATPAAAAPANGASGQVSGRLEQGQLKQLEAVANYVREHGKTLDDGDNSGLRQTLTKGLLNRHEFTAWNEAGHPGKISLARYNSAHKAWTTPTVYDRYFEINGDGSYTLAPNDQKKFERELTFWLDFAEAQELQ